MSNRVYTARQNFIDGWVLAAGRYTRPGAIGEIYNMQLDLSAEGALRQTWGLIPYAFWPNTASAADGQFKAGTPTVEGRRQGLAGVDTIKTGDAGVEDTVIYTDMQDDGLGNTDAVFYWVSPVTEATATWNLPYGNTITGIIGTLSEALEFRIRDFFWMNGWGNFLDLPITMSSSAPGFASTTGQTFSFTCPSTATTNTYTVSFTNTYTAQVETLSFEVSAADQDHGVGDIYAVCWDAWRDIDQTFMTTASILSRSGSPHTYTDIYYALGSPATWSGTGSMGKAINVFTSTWHPADQITPYQYGSAAMEVDSWASWVATSNPDTGSVTLYGTCTHHIYFPVSPVNGDTGDSGKSGWSSPLIEINRAASISQPQTGPLGIWKSASMNGRAFFYNGYSGTSFWIDVDDPTSTGSIGLSRPINVMAATTSARSGSSENKTNHPKKLVRYWISEIDGDGLESGLSATYTEINNDQYTDDLVELSNIPSASDSLSRISIYRSFSNGGKSPYHLKTGAKGATTWTYRDYKADDELGDPPWTHGDPPVYDAFCPVVYYDRLWYLGSRPDVTTAVRTTLFWSDINEPESFWWDGNWANVYGDDGDECTALVRDKTGLLVFKNNHLYLMAGRTPEEISFNEITVEDSDTGVGCPHANAVVATDFGVFFYWNTGVYRYFQGQVQRISTQIDPMLGGSSQAWGVNDDWEMVGYVDDWSVTMDYDAVEQVLYFGCQGDFATIKIAPDSNDTSDGFTFLLDVKNARWMGLYAGHFGFFQRANVKLYPYWDINYAPITSSDNPKVENFLTAASMDGSNGDSYPGFSVHHPLACVPSCTHWGRWAPSHWVKFRPISGDLGPYTSKRFIYIDYLISEAGTDTIEQSEVYSQAFLDSSANAASTITISVETGPVYSKLLRHRLGLVASELEAAVELDPTDTGGIYRLFEYGIGWQNLGREKAESPGATPQSPPGGPGIAGTPKALR